MEKLNVSIILEVLGRPAENVTDALSKLVERLGSEKGMKVKSKKIAEPKAVDGDLFTSFAEVELELDSIVNYFGILFGYLPSHVELINPDKVGISNFELNELANALTQKLHGYDAVAKKMIMENQILTQKLREVAPHLFKHPEPAQKIEQKESKAKKPKPKAKKAKKK